MLRVDWNLVFTIINLIVLYLLMNKFLIGPVMGIIEKRKELISSQLANASNTKAEADKIKGEYQKELDGINEKSKVMLLDAKKDANREYERIIGDANKESEKIIADANKTIDIEKERALRAVKSEIAELAMSVAEKAVGGSNGDLIDKSLYDQFLTEVGDGNDSNSD